MHACISSQIHSFLQACIWCLVGYFLGLRRFCCAGFHRKEHSWEGLNPEPEFEGVWFHWGGEGPTGEDLSWSSLLCRYHCFICKRFCFLPSKLWYLKGFSVVYIMLLFEKYLMYTHGWWGDYCSSINRFGKWWLVEGDGNISRASETLANLPSPFSDFITLKRAFAKKSLTVQDLVVLSGKNI